MLELLMLESPYASAVKMPDHTTVAMDGANKATDLSCTSAAAISMSGNGVRFNNQGGSRPVPIRIEPPKYAAMGIPITAPLESKRVPNINVRHR